MPDFRYIARDQTGQRLNGTIAAASRGEAVAALASQQIFPLQVDDVSHAVDPLRVRRVPTQLLAITYSQMADLLRSGVPLLRSLEVIQKQTSHSGLKSIVDEIRGKSRTAARWPTRWPTSNRCSVKWPSAWSVPAAKADSSKRPSPASLNSPNPRTISRSAP